MKILTLNTWQQYGPWKERWSLILDEIKKLNPDIIGFQEIFDMKWIEILKEELVDYFFYCPDQQSGLVLLSRFPIISEKLITFSHQSDSENKTRVALHITLKSDEGFVEAINTHLSWRPDEWSIRQGQVQELLDLCEASFEKNVTIVLGDFNAVPESLEIKKMREADGFVDMGARLGEVESLTWAHKNPYTMDSLNLCDGKPLPERRIDYIFLKKFSDVRQQKGMAEIVFNQGNAKGVWPSDHFGFFVKV